MPPARSSLPAKQAAKRQRAAKSPKDKHFDRLEKAIDDYSCEGSMLVVGIKSDDSEEEEEEEEDEEKDGDEEEEEKEEV